MADAASMEQLRQNLPRLLREHPEVRHELWGIMLEAFPSRQEFMELLQEMRAFREDTNRRFEELRQDMDRRFEAVERRFEAVDRRFEAIIEELRSHREQIDNMGRELREMRIGFSSLGIRVGTGL
jgi:chromosome segregation ATPase